MNYLSYQVEDFVLDASFQQWVYRPDPKSERFWKEFLNDHPEKKSDVESARQILLTFRLDTHRLADPDVRVLKRNIHRNIAAPQLTPTTETTRHHRLRPWLLRAAAITAFLIVSVGLIRYLMQPAETRYATEYNETRTVLLPDSSTVILNANSVLATSGRWDEASDRVVRLEGEAFFEVRKKPQLGNQKFLVQTGNATIEVVGTEFNVNNRRQKTQVVLSSGKVKLTSHLVSDREEWVWMEPGELATLSREQPEIVQQKVETERYTSWIDKKLILDNTSLQTIAELLEDQYGFEVIFEDPRQAERKFSATTTLSLNDVSTLLDLIEKSFHVQVIRQDQKIIIRSN